MSPLVNSSLKLQLPFLILSLLTGLTSSFINPVMSYFLIEEMNVQPFYLGIFTISVTLTGIGLSQYLGKLADNGWSAKKLYSLAMCSLAAAMCAFIIADSFLAIYICALLFMSIGAAAVPQMLTISGFWANSQQLNVAQFNARVRASLSLSWIVGPPTAFLLITHFGFSGSFGTAIFIACLALAYVTCCVPTQHQIKVKQKAGSGGNLNLKFYLIALAVFFGFSANIMYSSSMPLYVISELNLPSYLPGLLMGAVAAIEIPIMLFSTKLARFIPPARLIAIAFICSNVFYVGIFFSTQAWQFISLQIINAIFYGLYAGLGLTLIQEQAPEKTGFTSAFYSNAMKLGMMVGTTGTGLIGQFWQFRHANIGALIFSLLALASILSFIIINNARKSPK